MYRPKSRTELYKEKLKERELYSNNILDRFTNNGGGTSLKYDDGSIRTKRKTMLNNNYEDYFLNQRNRTPLSYNYNQQINSLQEMNSNNNNYNQTLPLGIIDNNVYNLKNINEIENNDTENINNEYQRQTFERRPRSQINYNNNYSNISTPNINNISRNEGRDYDHYQGTGVILKDNDLIENNKRISNQNLREEWLKEIKEKNEREAKRKQREKEEDLRAEEKYRRDREEELERERQEKLKLNDKLRDISHVNLQMIEDNINNEW